MISESRCLDCGAEWRGGAYVEVTLATISGVVRKALPQCEACGKPTYDEAAQSAADAWNDRASSVQARLQAKVQ